MKKDKEKTEKEISENKESQEVTNSNEDSLDENHSGNKEECIKS